MEYALRVSETFQKQPPYVAGGDMWVWEAGDFDNDFFKVILAVNVFIYQN